MKDGWGREINYMRLSITDRCNLRCKYCMPEGIAPTSHSEILTYEELLRLASCAVPLGITRNKVTGGEPLVRRGCVEFMARLKRLEGVEQVTLTTNGLYLSDQLDALRGAGLDGVNISIDALSPPCYTAITGYPGPIPDWGALLERCVSLGIPAKVNVVLQRDNRAEWVPLSALARDLPVDVRFIELMPLGWGGSCEAVPSEILLETLNSHWPGLNPLQARHGNGPARYFTAPGLQGRIGIIDAVSHSFCAACNRIRLTSTGWLKPCLCYEDGVDLKALLRGGSSDNILTEAIAAAVSAKPAAHCFGQVGATEHRAMSQIGG